MSSFCQGLGNDMLCGRNVEDRGYWRGAGLGSGGRHRQAPSRRLYPVVLSLEDRRLLATFHVTSTADDGRIGTLGWAVQQADEATTPSTIDFTLGNAPATITLSRGALELSNTVQPTSITGPGAGLLNINGDGASSVFQIDPQVTASLSGLTITGGSTSGEGGGVLNHGTASLTGCTISDNSGAYGGGVFSDDKLDLARCTISNNSATIEGGGLWIAGSADLDQCTISGNVSQDIGGGLQNRSDAFTMTGCTISGNVAEELGGGVYNQEMATITDCTISDNTAPRGGGGLVTGTVASTTLTDCTIGSNFAQIGAGLANLLPDGAHELHDYRQRRLRRRRRDGQFGHNGVDSLHRQRQPRPGLRRNPQLRLPR